MNRVLVVFSDGLLSELDSARGLVSRSAWIRQAVEDKLMKEAVAPLVPVELVEEAFKWPPVPEALKARVLAAVDEEVERKAEPKPKARRKKSVKDSPVASGSEDRESGSSFPAPAESPSLHPRSSAAQAIRTPQRCNRGACTGTIKPNGRCIRCNQEPLRNV